MFAIVQTYDGFCRVLTESARCHGILVRERVPAPWPERFADVPVRIVDGSFVSRGRRASRGDRLCEVALEGDGPRTLYVLLEPRLSMDPLHEGIEERHGERRIPVSRAVDHAAGDQRLPHRTHLLRRLPHGPGDVSRPMGTRTASRHRVQIGLLRLR